jgi:predicted 2-oxoglutarate/Fe(II)-dependent dioxygenase YbiX
MTNAPSLRPGDRLPDFVLPGLDRKLRKFVWSFVGDPVALIIASDLNLLDADQLGALRAACQQASVALVVATGTEIAAAGAIWKRLVGTEEAPLLLCDAEGKFLPTLLSQGGIGFGQAAGLRSRVLVLDPDQRIAATFDSRALPACAEAIGGIAAGVRADGASDTVVQSPMAPVLVLPRVFEPDFCAQVIRLWEKGDHADGGVSSRYGNVGVENLKRTEDYIVVEPMMLSAISNRLAYRIGPELVKVFNFDREFAFDAHVVLSYSAEGRHFFGPHRDNGAPTTSDRVFAVSLNLNDGFEGGELVFPEYSGLRVSPELGAAAVFSCSLLHRALPVTRGRRFVLTTFFRQKR